MSVGTGDPDSLAREPRRKPQTGMPGEVGTPARLRDRSAGEGARRSRGSQRCPQCPFTKVMFCYIRQKCQEKIGF